MPSHTSCTISKGKSKKIQIFKQEKSILLNGIACKIQTLFLRQSGVSSTIFKGALDLVYHGQNRDVREILRNVIGSLDDWER